MVRMLVVLSQNKIDRDDHTYTDTFEQIGAQG